MLVDQIAFELALHTDVEDALGLRVEQTGRVGREVPPTLVITDERDVLRSQGEEFARHLEQAGVPVTATRYEGVMHEFFGAAAVLDKAALAQLQAAEHLRDGFARVAQPVAGS